jgi:hypothetical protein
MKSVICFNLQFSRSNLMPQSTKTLLKNPGNSKWMVKQELMPVIVYYWNFLSDTVNLTGTFLNDNIGMRRC